MPDESRISDYIDTRCDRAYTVFILPSLGYDISIEMFDSKCRKCLPSCGAILASAAFLVIFRGLPLEAVEVEHDGKMSVVTFSENNTKISINLPKCKQLLEFKQIFASVIEKDVKKIFSKHENKVSLTVACDDAELFEKSHLSALLTKVNDADFSIAYSKSESQILTSAFSARSIPDLSLFAALSAYESIGERRKMTAACKDACLPPENYAPISLAPVSGGVKVSISPPPLMSFDTPFL